MVFTIFENLSGIKDAAANASAFIELFVKNNKQSEIIGARAII